ncbi:Calcium/calmodulin-dependent protein kinase type I [Yamadazyma tenuis]|uniref:Kinase-like protein n=1 Tax=Candida tenuis (strain ATCC 10573 / BCRC 21748 / CBS 615 / JCM 9827 / NBRC 10315 / NRRL Y-1498 / VKM Y-70) TaxID=590646 RepID=G3B397_CANTC|nr:kinase-like protein [Yamadazyma tenuis ATCC 10573]EGV64116.1 kinase-like protein [Yamadazyma tenuis ATCC 10573]WEJ96249.1 Calcium/calmodulin-dependent protein kinase type I [Yamadazyma tenuis]
MTEQSSWPPKEATNKRRNSYIKFDSPCNYTVSKKALGEGSYSTVFECKNIKTSRHYAAKRYTKKLVYGIEDMLQNEFSVLKAISQSHKNLLSLVDYFETEQFFFLVTDLAKGGELFDRIITGANERLAEFEAVKVTKQLVDTIEFLHSKNIIHRDIKAENILFQTKTSTNILLADFGSARVLSSSEKLYNRCGTLSYMAPQTLNKSGYSFEADMWAVGVLVYFMLCGYMPFDCETDEETMEAITKGDYMFEPTSYWNHISSAAKDFIRQCFQLDPDKRMTAEEANTHPFVSPLTSKSSYSSYLNLNSLASNTPSSIFTSSASNLSLANKLKESLQNLQNIQRDPRASYTLSRTSSDFGDEKLKGAMCESPNIISKFSTPVASTAVSRAASVEQITSSVPKLSVDQKHAPTTFYI